jgi:spastin
MVKRIYVPLPDAPARAALLQHLLTELTHEFDEGIEGLVAMTEGYSCSDLTALCKDAAMGPIRDLGMEALRTARPEDVLPITAEHFVSALQRIRPSVSPSSLGQYERWNATYGSN